MLVGGLPMGVVRLRENPLLLQRPQGSLSEALLWGIVCRLGWVFVVWGGLSSYEAVVVIIRVGGG